MKKNILKLTAKNLILLQAWLMVCPAAWSAQDYAQNTSDLISVRTVPALRQGRSEATPVPSRNTEVSSSQALSKMAQETPLQAAPSSIGKKTSVRAPTQTAISYSTATSTEVQMETRTSRSQSTERSGTVALSSITTRSSQEIRRTVDITNPVTNRRIPSGTANVVQQTPSAFMNPPAPEGKLTGLRISERGFEINIEVSAGVTAFDILYKDDIAGTWKFAKTIQIAASPGAQTIFWTDDGTQTDSHPKTAVQRFYSIKIRTTVSDPQLATVSSISIPEQGLTTDTPYYVLTYQVTDDKGAISTKTIPYDLKTGVNEIIIREKNSIGNELIVKRKITHQSPEDALTDAQKVFRQTVLNENSRYFVEGIGVDSASGFPLDFIGVDAPAGGAPWTQPTSIGFYLQFLSDVITRKITVIGITPEQALASAGKTLTTLLDVQTQLGWNGLIPWLKLRPPKPDRSQIVFLDNINLSQSVAVMLGSLEKANLQSGAAKEIYQKGTDFLSRQKTGYQKFYNSQTGQLYAFYETGTSTFRGRLDRLGNEVRSGVAFAVAYFGVHQNAWTHLEMRLKNYTTWDQKTWATISPYDGGAFQVFWNILRAPEQEIPKMHTVLWNAFVAYVDNMQAQKLPGFLSASSLPGGGYDGKIGVNTLAETSDPLRSDIGSLYALGAAYLLDPSKVLSLIESVKKGFPQIVGVNGFYDAASKAGAVSQNYYAIDQGSLIVGLVGNGPSSMKLFLQNRNLLEAFNGLYQKLNITFSEAPKMIPEPPAAPDPGTSAKMIENFDDVTSLVQSITGIDNVYKFTEVDDPEAAANRVMKVEYTKRTGLPYSFMTIQTKTGSVNFADYKTFRFRFKKTSAAAMSLNVKFESSSGAIEKIFNIAAGSTGWQDLIYTLPANSPILRQTSKVLFFADAGKTNTSGSFLIDDLEFRK